MAGLMANGGAAAEEADRQWMTVRLGGQRYRLLRALDDGASEHQDPDGPEQILLRADLPDITPHVMKEEYRGESPFLGAMIEILASSVAPLPKDQGTVTPEMEERVMGQTLGVLFNPAHPDRPVLKTESTANLTFPAPKGGGMKLVVSPKPFQDLYPKVFFAGEQTAPTDIISAGGGECVQFFVHATAIFQVTYGEHLVDTWSSVKRSIASLLDQSRI